jgi:hypothetical protein
MGCANVCCRSDADCVTILRGIRSHIGAADLTRVMLLVVEITTIEEVLPCLQAYRWVSRVVLWHNAQQHGRLSKLCSMHSKGILSAPACLQTLTNTPAAVVIVNQELICLCTLQVQHGHEHAHGIWRWQGAQQG